MPTDIQNLLALDYKSLATSVVILMVGWIALKTIFEKFTETLGIEFAFTRKKRELKERTEKLEKRINEIVEILDDVKELKTTVKALSESISQMRDRQNANERARLKDRILQAYRHYKEKGEWSTMEREAMLGLIESYRENGEYNTYVNDVIAIDIENFKIID